MYEETIETEVFLFREVCCNVLVRSILTNDALCVTASFYRVSRLRLIERNVEHRIQFGQESVRLEA